MGVIRFEDLGDDELLVAAARDPQAFGAFYDRFEAQVLAFFMRATGRADVAADLTAEVFASALASIGAFQPELGSARGWLFGIARHQLARTWRRRRVENTARRRLGLEPLVLTDEALERIEALAGPESGRALELLAELPVDQRSAVEGHILEDQGYPALAQSLSCSQDVVRQRVSRGLRTLRERLEGIR